ncbi:MAG TPA: FHA domain-containing protein [Polyangiaceae bacterium]|nr:FHA domain-containing protein [Polyangiaceae bacterium]
MKLRIETEQGHLDWATLDAPVVTLGRDAHCEVRLLDRNVSRRHASLRRRPEGGWVLVDLDSYNGSFLNGRRLVGESRLSPRDLVQIGDYFLSLDTDEVDLSATMAGRPTPPPGSRTHKLLPVDGAAGAVPAIDLSKGQLTIGSFGDCKVRIEGAALAGVRVRLRPLAGERFEILDESERPSMFVNGVELRRKVLEIGDLVELGDALMLGLDARLACALRYVGDVRERHAARADGTLLPLPVRPAAGAGRKSARPKVNRGERPPSERVEEAQVVLRGPGPEGDAAGARIGAIVRRALIGGRLPTRDEVSEIGGEARALGKGLYDRGADLAENARRAGASLSRAERRFAALVVGAFVGGLLLALLVALAKGARPTPAAAHSAPRHRAPEVPDPEVTVKIVAPPDPSGGAPAAPEAPAPAPEAPAAGGPK